MKVVCVLAWPTRRLGPETLPAPSAHRAVCVECICGTVWTRPGAVGDSAAVECQLPPGEEQGSDLDTFHVGQYLPQFRGH